MQIGYNRVGRWTPTAIEASTNQILVVRQRLFILQIRFRKHVHQSNSSLLSPLPFSFVVNRNYLQKWKLHVILSYFINTLHACMACVQGMIFVNTMDCLYIVWVKSSASENYLKNVRQNQRKKIFWVKGKFDPNAIFWMSDIFCLSKIILNILNKGGK